MCPRTEGQAECHEVDGDDLSMYDDAAPRNVRPHTSAACFVGLVGCHAASHPHRRIFA